MISDDCFLNLDLDWLLFLCFSAPSRSLRLHHLHRGPDAVRHLRLVPGAGNEEQDHRGDHGTVPAKQLNARSTKSKLTELKKKQLRRKKHLPLTWSFPEKVSIFGLLPQPSLSKVPPPFMLVEKKAKISPNVIPVVWQHGRHR